MLFVRARLYGMAISHPANAARLMLEHKGIAYDLVDVMPGSQAALVRLAGFRAGTVPAIKLAGRKAQGTRAISRLLEELQPDPPLFPAEPSARRAVEDAEAWGEQILQPVPRRLLRHAIRHSMQARRTFARMLGLPAPDLVARTMIAPGMYYARREDAASRARIAADWAQTPALLDHVDELIAGGVIGGEELNAADFQIGTTLRVMGAFVDFRPLLAGRPAEALGRRVWPDYEYEVPSLLPPALSSSAP